MAHTNPRQTQFQQVHYFRKRFNWNDAGIGTGVYIGTVPAGSIIVGTDYYVDTAFNAGTTNVVTVGGNASSYNDVLATPTNTTGTLGQNVAPTGSSKGPLAADLDLFAMYTSTGTAPSAGQIDVVIKYIPNNDQ